MKLFFLFISLAFIASFQCTDRNKTSGALQTRVAILGSPSFPDVEWNEQNLNKIKKLGFNAIQLNIAWGSRPADEPLTLEDVVDLPPEKAYLQQSLPLRCDTSAVRMQQRRQELKKRIALCKKTGLRSIFHFGAPFNHHARFGNCPPNHLLDGRTPEYYVAMLKAFAAEYPGVDDILIYTYDQDAWLRAEFAVCDKDNRHIGIPLDEKVVPFLEKLSATWHAINPNGRLWWEPWELSAGESLTCIEKINPKGFGLALHCNIAEVLATLPVDRWLKNASNLAGERNIPVIVEYWLGGATEDLEPYQYIPFPLVTLRGLQAIASVPHVTGIKEYYGLIPTREDANLRMTSIFFHNPQIDEKKALGLLAKPYGTIAGSMIQYWQLISKGMELFPWETSWFIRKLGRSNPVHAMSAAFLRGYMVATPSWRSTRHAIFMKIDDDQPHFWMLEDVQLRCQLAAEPLAQAIALGDSLQKEVPDEMRDEFSKGLQELKGFHQRALAYAFHIRETNLAMMMRDLREHKLPIPQRMKDELIAVLEKDQKNQGQQEPIGSALQILQKNRDRFLDIYFKVPGEKGAAVGDWTTPNLGLHSVTSR